MGWGVLKKTIIFMSSPTHSTIEIVEEKLQQSNNLKNEEKLRIDNKEDTMKTESRSIYV